MVLEKESKVETEIVMPMDDREFRQAVASSRVSLGMFSEMTCAADCFSRGYLVSRPLADGSRYDLVVDRNGSLERVQVKTMSKTGSVPIGILKYKHDTYGKGVYDYTIAKYSGSEFDFLAAVDRDTKIVYYIPVVEIDFTKANVPLGKNIRERYLTF